uniref:C2H2-type domain-containing protein n=1 Tax=Ignisphaera aggregans TaxID=334771 RepID=A0A7J2U1K2_9CREN
MSEYISRCIVSYIYGDDKDSCWLVFPLLMAVTHIVLATEREMFSRHMCPICGKRIRSKKGLRLHIANKHRGLNTLVREAYEKYRELLKHIAEHSPAGKNKFCIETKSASLRMILCFKTKTELASYILNHPELLKNL